MKNSLVNEKPGDGEDVLSITDIRPKVVVYFVVRYVGLF
jgi:hypothetical protein